MYVSQSKSLQGYDVIFSRGGLEKSLCPFELEGKGRATSQFAYVAYLSVVALDDPFGDIHA